MEKWDYFDFRDDEILRLRAQNGYLKHKLAKLQSKPNANDKSVPTIYVITPTYKRPIQKAELTRLCHTFLLGMVSNKCSLFIITIRERWKNPS